MILPSSLLLDRGVDVASNYHALERRLVNGTSLTLNLGANPDVLLDTWLILYSLAQFLLLLLIGTLFVRWRGGNGRGLTLLNFLFTLFLNCVVVCILYYPGQQANPNPPLGLCLTQATLKHGTGPLVQVAILCLAIHVFLSTRASINAHHDSPWTVRILLAVPYFAFLLGALPVLVIGLENPVLVERVEHLYYCSLNNDLYGDISTFFGVIVLLATAGIQTRTVVLLRRSWLATRSLRASGAIDVSLIIRICVLVAVQIIYVIATFIATLSSGVASDWVASIIEALVPIVAFAVFGLRRQILQMWFFCFAAPTHKSLTSTADSGHSSAYAKHPRPPHYAQQAYQYPEHSTRPSPPKQSTDWESEKRDSMESASDVNWVPQIRSQV